MPYFRATEQLVQLTERERNSECVVRERERGLKEGGNRKVGGWAKSGDKMCMHMLPKEQQKGLCFK